MYEEGFSLGKLLHMAQHVYVFGKMLHFPLLLFKHKCNCCNLKLYVLSSYGVLTFRGKDENSI